MNAVTSIESYRPAPKAQGAATPDDRIVRIKELAGADGRTGLSRATIYRLMASGDFPQAVPLGGRSVGWLNSAINAWIAQRGRGGAA